MFIRRYQLFWMNVNSLPRVLYLKTCENPNNNILQSEYLDKHDKYFSSAGSLMGVLPRPQAFAGL